MDSSDEAYMRRAIAVAALGRLTAPPNPWVGCVIVAGGAVVGEGYHSRPGEPHAEPQALAAAGVQARGATAYVTLEPCAHHGRTPPCADALITAGVSRVVVGVEDPDPLVAGLGLSRLREAGVDVTVGVEAAAVKRSLRPYLHHRQTGRPFFILKAAVSVDGRTAASDGSSQWITTPEARRDVQRLRAESQAIVVGAGTAVNDDPRLTIRDASLTIDRQPLRVLLDGKARAPATGHLADTALAPTLVAAGSEASHPWISHWQEAGGAIWQGKDRDLVDLEALAVELGSRGILQVLIEGGSNTYQAFWEAGLVDSFVAYVGPKLLGRGGLPLLPIDVDTIENAPVLHLEECTVLGDSVRLDYSI